jgi:sugar/nucleoside kinase (ribokinase family)
VLATLGDLVEDIVVDVQGSIRRGSDTPSVIRRRRGGSAANVAETAAQLGHPARFIGQVGDDRAGDGLVDDLAAGGVDTSCVRRRGSTSAIVVLVDDRGERTFLTDRRASIDLADPHPSWLDGVTALHVPFYSFVDPPLGDTARTLVGWANDGGVAVSVDLSSESVLEGFGIEKAHRLVAECRPAVVFANIDEARVMKIEQAMGSAVTVVKRGSRPALVHQPGHESVEVAAVHLPGVVDTTAAGDAFAAGFLCHRSADTGWRADPVGACAAGHRAAAELIQRRALGVRS